MAAHPGADGGRFRVHDLCGGRMAGGAVSAGRRRATLPHHHAEPAEDGDLRIENNHTPGTTAAIAGELQAGLTGAADVNGEIYSIHAPGLPALVAPAFAVAGYHGVWSFLLLVAASGSALAWHLAWVVTRRAMPRGSAGRVTCRRAPSFTASPFTRTAGGVIALTGVWALCARAGIGERDGTDRSVVAARRGARPCCRGSTPASRSLPDASARWCFCASPGTPTPRGRRSRSSRAGSERARAGWDSSWLSTARPIRRPLTPTKRVGGVHPRRASRDCSSISASASRVCADLDNRVFPGLAVMVRRRAHVAGWGWSSCSS